MSTENRYEFEPTLTVLENQSVLQKLQDLLGSVNRGRDRLGNYKDRQFHQFGRFTYWLTNRIVNL